MHRDNGRAAETRGLNANEPGRIGFREDLDVVGLRAPEAMQHDPARAMALILLDVEKRLRIARPYDVSGRPDDAVHKVRLALKVADGDRQHLGAELVGGPGEFRMVGRMTGGGEMKKRLSLRARVAVDQHRLCAAFARLAAIDAALTAGTKARVIGPRPVDLRRLAVILLEARAHLALELFLQAERRRQNRVGVGVLGLEQRADVGRQPAQGRAAPRASCRPASSRSHPPRKGHVRRASPAGLRLAAARETRLASPVRAPIACGS